MKKTFTLSAIATLLLLNPINIEKAKSYTDEPENNNIQEKFNELQEERARRIANSQEGSLNHSIDTTNIRDQEIEKKI